MGMYTGLRLKGKIKEEYSYPIELIVDRNNIGFEIINKTIKELDNKDTDCIEMWMIPHGGLSYMPTKWYELEDNVFYTKYDSKTRELTFDCSMKNYKSQIEHFIEYTAPLIFESIDFCESIYEENLVSTLYVLDKDSNKLITLPFGIKYTDDSEDYDFIQLSEKEDNLDDNIKICNLLMEKVLDKYNIDISFIPNIDKEDLFFINYEPNPVVLLSLLNIDNKDDIVKILDEVYKNKK